MKRLAWLFLAVFCTALAQVQRVELPVASEKTCDCCDQPGACGMPDCSLPPAAIPVVYTAEHPATLARPAVVREVARNSAAVREFWAAMLAPAARPGSPAVPIEPLPPPQVPLFRAHCALLI